ncbi:hypothetical protein ANH9776_10065 [Aggregatibacter actinomycetemcomitans serotype e str. ANH9776]|nr:hypothetical protein SA3096_09585 [Aggregatibacter actinomycetemcomitans serotype e str. SA3096]KYK91873.1 hypothetical protein ANH9776_10065 [Aggregatibacter actinomycetemcomitans serotype e str. ANH9776]
MLNQKIRVPGDAVVDLIPDGENHYLRYAGGAPANVAEVLAGALKFSEEELTLLTDAQTLDEASEKITALCPEN